MDLLAPLELPDTETQMMFIKPTSMGLNSPHLTSEGDRNMKRLNTQCLEPSFDTLKHHGGGTSKNKEHKKKLLPLEIRKQYKALKYWDDITRIVHRESSPL